MIIVCTIPSNFLTEAHSEKNNIVEVKCKHHLSKFIMLGESAYKERYQYNRIIDDCIKLFNDPSSNLYFDISDKAIGNEDRTFNQIYMKSVGTNTHIVKYQVCNNEKVSKSKILFQSNAEKSKIILAKPLLPKQCTVFTTELKHTNTDSVKLSWTTEEMKNIKSKKIF